VGCLPPYFPGFGVLSFKYNLNLLIKFSSFSSQDFIFTLWWVRNKKKKEKEKPSLLTLSACHSFSCLFSLSDPDSRARMRIHTYILLAGL
jgi:hypothetical protein